jgi:hypothetical protein
MLLGHPWKCFGMVGVGEQIVTMVEIRVVLSSRFPAAHLLLSQSENNDF